MARLVAVCRDGEEEYPFSARQMPLSIDETLTMVIEFPKSELDFASNQFNGLQLKQFIEHYNMLKEQDLKMALVVMPRKMFNSLSELVPCVGCRRSVERLFSRIAEAGFYALEPLTVGTAGVLSITNSCLSDPRQLYTLFYVHGPKLNDTINAIPKTKKNKRCQLHSLDTHKSRPLGGSWIDVWERMSKECREEVVLIDNACLLETLETYLQKHRFCTDCKNKVLRAYNILVGELECSKEKDYCASLYEGLRCCPQDHHIHVCSETDYIAHLLGRAEPEFMGGYERRERHAKTIDVAQEEVLTCLGIHLFERLHRVWQKLRAEEQTWRLLYYFCIDKLRKSFETTVDEIKGFCRLEQLCEELSEEERARELKQEKKRQKRKNRRKNKCVLNECEQEVKVDQEKILDEGLPDSVDGGCKSCGSGEEFGGSVEAITPMEDCTCSTTAILCSPKTKNGGSSHCNGSDCGYSSSMEGSEMGSREGSDVACSEGMCNHDETGEDACVRPCTEDKEEEEEDGVFSCVVCWANSNEQTKGKSKKKKRKNKGPPSENKQDPEGDDCRPDDSRIAPQSDSSRGSTPSVAAPTPCPDQSPVRSDVSPQPHRQRGTVDLPPPQLDLNTHGELSIKTLMELLDEAATTTDEENCLTQDEIRSFVEENKSFYSMRHQYRQHLKERFTKYCHSSVCSVAPCLPTNSVK